MVVAWGGALLLFPLMVRALHRFRACGHSFGALPFDFNTPSVGRYYSVLAVFIVAMFVAILPIFFIIVAIWYVEVPSVLIDIMPLLAFGLVFLPTLLSSLLFCPWRLYISVYFGII